nr:hypothetical protein [Enterococcus casseliflavus]
MFRMQTKGVSFHKVLEVRSYAPPHFHWIATVIKLYCQLLLYHINQSESLILRHLDWFFLCCIDVFLPSLQPPPPLRKKRCFYFEKELMTRRKNRITLEKQNYNRLEDIR